MFRLSLLYAIPAAAALAADFEGSYQPGSRDVVGRFMGGTEMRVSAAHAGKLYAGNGYWEDTAGREGGDTAFLAAFAEHLAPEPDGTVLEHA
jgi:hypothetical protein